MSAQTNAKLFALRETIANAIKDGSLKKKMDVLQLQAAELGLEEQALNNLIAEQKKMLNKQNTIIQIVQGKRILLSALCLIAVAIEWGIGLWIALPPQAEEAVNESVAESSFSFSTVIWLLLANLLTILLIVFVIAYILNKKVKN